MILSARSLHRQKYGCGDVAIVRYEDHSDEEQLIDLIEFIKSIGGTAADSAPPPPPPGVVVPGPSPVPGP